MEPNDVPAAGQRLDPAPALRVLGGLNPVTPATVDTDVYTLELSAPFLSVRASVTDGAGGCPQGADPVLGLWAADDTLVAENDDGWSGTLCSLLDPRVQRKLHRLPAGTYTLRVQPFRADRLMPAYALDVEVIPAGCPNTLVDPGETCDDGNTVPGDGCDPACRTEALLTPEREPDDTQATATMLVAGTAGFLCSSVPSDGDWLGFSLGSTSDVTLTLVDDRGLCPFNGDLVLHGAGAPVISSWTCDTFTPAARPELRALPPGEYQVHVQPSVDGDVYAWMLLVWLTAPACGDGILQPPEECDAPVSGCAPGCVLAEPLVSETEPNNTLAEAVAAPVALKGRLDPVSTDQDWFALDVNDSASTLAAQLDNGLGGCPEYAALGLDLLDGAGTVLASAQYGVGCLALDPRVQPGAAGLAAGRYFLRVTSPSGGRLAVTYVLRAQVRPPGCGDLVLQTGEQCDDGNTAAGDGCAGCLTEMPFEVEPNGSADSAQSRLPGAGQLLPAGGRVAGNVAPLGDYDWFVLDLPAGGSPRIYTTDLPGTGCPADTMLEVWPDGAGAQLAADDDDGWGTCSLLDGSGAAPQDPALTALAPGRYHVAVRGYADATVVMGYQLHVEFP